MPATRIRSTVVVAGTGIALLGTFLPWVRSGERDRSSYDLAEVVRRLGLLSSPAARAAVWCWSAVPVVLAIGLGAMLLRGGVAARCVATITSLYPLVVAVWLWQSPVQVRVGVPVTAVGAALVLLGGVLPTVTRRASTPLGEDGIDGLATDRLVAEASCVGLEPSA